MRKWLPLIGWTVLVFAVINSGVVFTVTGDGSWYQGLAIPAWGPPTWVFGPAWFVNCVLMSVAVWRVWRVSWFGTAVGLFLAHLLLAGLFTPVFFGAQSTVGGAAIMWATLAALLATIVAFFGKDKTAGWLLVPYLGWIGYATSVATGIWWLNR